MHNKILFSQGNKFSLVVVLLLLHKVATNEHMRTKWYKFGKVKYNDYRGDISYLETDDPILPDLLGVGASFSVSLENGMLTEGKIQHVQWLYCSLVQINYIFNKYTTIK